ncbi:amidohydrolase [Sulfolobales archaeon HS-7]|nr:amidohydrolase [Sulfolobales archaeon HS-7]
MRKYVDGHTHLWPKESLTQEMRERGETVGYSIPDINVSEVVREMDEADIDFVVVIAYPMRKLWNAREDFPLRVIDACKEYPDRFSIVGGIEVNELTTEEVKKWLEVQYSSGVTGFKLHPPHMWVKPNDYREEERGLKGLELLYQFAEDHDLPVIIHTGTSFFLTARNKYADPVFVDDVAVDFPKLRVIMAHMGRPSWTSAAFQLVRIRRNVYGDLSSIPPKRLTEYLPRVDEIADKLIYGSDAGGPGVKGLKAHLTEFLNSGVSLRTKEVMTRDNPRKFFRVIER